MKIFIDLNIILDYLEDRAPFADEAENVIEDKGNQLFVSAHMVTTAFYLMRGHGIKAQNAVLDFIFDNFTVLPCDTSTLIPARALEFIDYEDAVAAAAAKKAKCAYIITRNKRDFANSPVPALTPGEFLTLRPDKSPAQQFARVCRSSAADVMRPSAGKATAWGSADSA